MKTIIIGSIIFVLLIIYFIIELCEIKKLKEERKRAEELMQNGRENERCL